LSINPTVADSWNSRGTAFNDLQPHAEALADFDRTIALNPRAAAEFGTPTGQFGHARHMAAHSPPPMPPA
jgi:hypothetical protein